MTKRINVMYAGFVVESATTPELFARPSHPYTIGLLHSIPRLDSDGDEDLIPIEGRPPDQRVAPVGCPFAPRCAWRVEPCWSDNPGLAPLEAGTSVVMTGPGATHRIACFNPPTHDEALAGRPLRDGFKPARPPGSLPDETGFEGLASEEALEALEPQGGELSELMPRDEALLDAARDRGQYPGDADRDSHP